MCCNPVYVISELNFAEPFDHIASNLGEHHHMMAMGLLRNSQNVSVIVILAVLFLFTGGKETSDLIDQMHLFHLL